MSKNTTIFIDACEVRIEPSTGSWVSLSFDMLHSDLDELISHFDDNDVLDCVDEGTIIKYLKDKGYNVSKD